MAPPVLLGLAAAAGLFEKSKKSMLETKQHRLLVQDTKLLSQLVSTGSDELKCHPARRPGLATKCGAQPRKARTQQTRHSLSSPSHTTSKARASSQHTCGVAVSFI